MGEQEKYADDMITKLVSIGSLKEIDILAETYPEIDEELKTCQAGHVTIDVTHVMECLTNVGDLIHVAVSGSNGHPCSVPVTAMLCDYQALVKMSHRTTGQFAEASLEALKFHKFAIKLLQKKQFDLSLKMLGRTSELAKAMVVVSQGLVDESQKLCTECREALISATSDGVSTHVAQNENAKRLAESKATQAKLRAKDIELQRAHKEIEEKEREAAGRLKDARNRQFILGLAKAIVKTAVSFPTKSAGLARMVLSGLLSVRGNGAQEPAVPENVYIKELIDLKLKLKSVIDSKNEKISEKEAELDRAEDDKKADDLKRELETLKTELKKHEAEAKNIVEFIETTQKGAKSEIEAEAEMQMRYAQQAFEYRKELIATNAELAESLERLKGATEKNDQLEMAVRSLELVTITLGKVKTTFENVKIYWEQVRQNCHELTGVANVWGDQDVAFALGEAEFNRALVDSAWNWLVQIKTYREAYLSMKDVDSKIDSIVCSLPTRDEALNVVKRKSEKMKAFLVAENKALKDR